MVAMIPTRRCWGFSIGQHVISVHPWIYNLHRRLSVYLHTRNLVPCMEIQFQWTNRSIWIFIFGAMENSYLIKHASALYISVLTDVYCALCYSSLRWWDKHNCNSIFINQSKCCWFLHFIILSKRLLLVFIHEYNITKGYNHI